jgi:hypothetical protein
MPEGIVFCGIWESLRGKKDEASKESGARIDGDHRLPLDLK